MLVERAEELARVDAVLGAARSGTGRTLLVEGPAGIGKSSLLAAARERAAQYNEPVLRDGLPSSPLPAPGPRAGFA